MHILKTFVLSNLIIFSISLSAAAEEEKSVDPACEAPIHIARNITKIKNGVLLQTVLKFKNNVSSPSYYPRGLPIEYDIQLSNDGNTVSISTKIENDANYDNYAKDFFNQSGSPNPEIVRWYIQTPDEVQCPALDLTTWDTLKKKLKREPKLSIEQGKCHGGENCLHMIMENMIVQ